MWVSHPFDPVFLCIVLESCDFGQLMTSTYTAILLAGVVKKAAFGEFFYQGVCLGQVFGQPGGGPTMTPL